MDGEDGYINELGINMLLFKRNQHMRANYSYVGYFFV